VAIAAGLIGRITTGGAVTEFPLPDRAGRPHAITPGADGALWFTEWGGNRVGSITTDGVIETHDLPTPGSEPHGITLGPDGALWTALETGALARIA
jgi:virginiamycin B lyase